MNTKQIEIQNWTILRQLQSPIRSLRRPWRSIQIHLFLEIFQTNRFAKTEIYSYIFYRHRRCARAIVADLRVSLNRRRKKKTSKVKQSNNKNAKVNQSCLYRHRHHLLLVSISSSIAIESKRVKKQNGFHKEKIYTLLFNAFWFFFFFFASCFRTIDSPSLFDFRLQQQKKFILSPSSQTQYETSSLQNQKRKSKKSKFIIIIIIENDYCICFVIAPTCANV